MTFFRPRRRGCLSSLMSPLSSSTLEEGLTRETSVSLTLYHGNSTLINLFDSNSTVECVRSCDQKPYLHNETKGRFCIKIEFNPQKNISLLQHGRPFFVYSTNMAAVTSCEHTLLPSPWEGGEKRVDLFFNRVALCLFTLWICLGCSFHAILPRACPFGHQASWTLVVWSKLQEHHQKRRPLEIYLVTLLVHPVLPRLWHRNTNRKVRIASRELFAKQ